MTQSSTKKILRQTESQSTINPSIGPSTGIIDPILETRSGLRIPTWEIGSQNPRYILTERGRILGLLLQVEAKFTGKDWRKTPAIVIIMEWSLRISNSSWVKRILNIV